MSIVIDMGLIRLIEQGKCDPGEITDLLIAAGYSKQLAPDELVKATVMVCRLCDELDLPPDMDPKSASEVMATVLNEIVSDALEEGKDSSAKVAAAVINAGFTKVVSNE